MAVDEPGQPEPFEAHEGTVHETPGEHKVFPPFDATTFASQLLWFAITFVLLPGPHPTSMIFSGDSSSIRDTRSIDG